MKILEAIWFDRENNTYIAYPENKYKPKKSSLNFGTYQQRTFQKRFQPV